MNSRHVVLVVRWPTGGIRTYLKYVYPHVIRAGWRATIIAPPEPELAVLKEDLRGCDVDFHWAARGGVVLSMANSLLALSKGQKVDLVHSHGLTSAVSVSSVASILRAPHLATLHDVFHDDQFMGLKGRMRHMAIDAALRPIERIQAVSRDAHANLLQAFPRLASAHERTCWIRNGIDSSRFSSASKRDLRAELGLSEQHVIVGFLGRFMSQKGFTYLVKAIERLRHTVSLARDLIVVAVGDGGFIREDRAEIERRGLSSYFRFLPFSPDAAPAIKGMDVVVMPSLWEACPLLAMEVMAAGIPLIGTSCIGLREILDGSPAVVVPPSDEVSLAEALANYVNDPVTPTLSAASFSSVARKRFDVAGTAVMLEKEMRLVIGEKCDR